MRAAVLCGPRCFQVAGRPDPVVAAPTDAVVRVVLGCVCGSDLWYYRGESPHDLGPIGHEFIVGGPDVHARHANGHEAYHPPVPGELSVPADDRASTTYTFHAPGAVEFACHLPGHYQYGMHGNVVVVPEPR